jgi:glutamine synthetase
VRSVARRFGLRASFLPKIFVDRAGSGCHLHLSLWNKDQNLVPDPQAVAGVSTIAQAFIAGILKHLPALMALTTPTPNSYRRLRPHNWSGAFACWGLDNREAAIRVPENPAGGATNFELRTGDASANPYLALGAVITAGLDGVKGNLELGEPLSSDPGYLSAEEQSARGIIPLPTNLFEAIESLKRDELLLDALGPGLAMSYLAVRKAEFDVLSKMELEDEVKLLAERY